MLSGSQPLATVTSAAVHVCPCTMHGVHSPGCAPGGGTLARRALSPALLNSCPTKGPTPRGSSLYASASDVPSPTFLSGCFCIVCLRGSARPGVALSVFLLGICSASRIPSPSPPSVLSSGIRHVTCTSSFLPLHPSGLASKCPSLEGRWGRGTQGCCATAGATPTTRSPGQASASSRPGRGRVKAGLRGHPGRLPGSSAVAMFQVSEHSCCGDFAS